ncbi:flavodoxin domain-containing protein [Roseibium sp.]
MGARVNFLIAYATTEGQTDKIARYMAAALTEDGHEVRFHNVSDLSGGLTVTDYDKVIVAGSVHSGKHQPDLELFAFANRERLNQVPGLLVSVSLAAAFPDTLNEARGYVDTLLEATHWKPAQVILIAGAVKPGNYDWFEKSALLEGDLAGHLNEDLQETREFTDWGALKQQVAEFARS